MPAWQEPSIVHICSYQSHRTQFNLLPKISKADARQSIIGKACKSHQCRLDKKIILHIRSYQIHPLQFNLQPKISKTYPRQSTIGKVCKSHQHRLDKNKLFSLFIAIKSMCSSSTYILKCPKQLGGNQ